MTTAALVFAILQAVATFAGLGLVGTGLFTWRRQLHGTVEYELARRLLRRVYEVRDKIDQVRSPMIPGGEFDAAFKEAGVTPSGRGGADDPQGMRLVYNRRWGLVTAAVSDLRVELLEAEVLWGKAAQEANRALQATLGELYAAIVQYVRQAEHPEVRSRMTQEQWDKMHNTLYWQGSLDADAFSAKLLAAIEEFESIVRPHLRRSAVKSLVKR